MQLSKVLRAILALYLLIGLNETRSQQNPSISCMVDVDMERLLTDFTSSPDEPAYIDGARPFNYALPLPDGGDVMVQVIANDLMSSEFGRAFPQIRSFDLIAEGRADLYGHATISPEGLLVNFMMNGRLVEIFPDKNGRKGEHVVTYSADNAPQFDCQFLPEDEGEVQLSGKRLSMTNGDVLRTYNLAIVTTGEFGQWFGGTVPAVSAVVTQMVGTIEAIYEKELAVNFNLLTPLVYLDPNTDPFNSANTDRLSMVEAAIQANWPVGDYDLGHCLHSHGGNAAWAGGIAAYGLCNNSTKAEGWSTVGLSSLGNPWLFAHEVGHQFHMDHTFNGSGGSCTANIHPIAAYEIGSGSTIMSYRGLCGSGQNVISLLDNHYYFHAHSLNKAITQMTASNCASETLTNNAPPSINANPCGGTHTIPKGTPFLLTGSGTDADNEHVSYCWEQYNEDGTGSPSQGKIGAAAAADPIAPLFRSYPPQNDPIRYFPHIDEIRNNNYVADFEPLPSVARTLDFQLTGRDNRPGGGGTTSEMLSVTVSDQGPFEVTAPNGGEIYTTGNAITVSWDVNGTTAFCNDIKIILSVDDGRSYPYILVRSTANDGSELVTLPGSISNTTEARIMVACAESDCVTFFDISNGGFTINSDCVTQGSAFGCDHFYESFDQGDPGLNLSFLNLENQFVTSHNFNITPADPSMTLIGWDPTTSFCESYQMGAWTTNYQVFSFVVDVEGTYDFEFSSTTDYRVAHLYETSFDPNNNCTNFKGSSFRTSGSIAYFIRNPGVLSPCKVYHLVGTNFIGGSASFPVNISGPGNVQPVLVNAPNTGYTYAAVSQSSDTVVQVNSSADFTSIDPGNYSIYGISYYNGAGPTPPMVNPSTWVGQSVFDIYNSGDCAQFSSNYKPIEVVDTSLVASCIQHKSYGSVGINDFVSVASQIQVATSEPILDVNVLNITGSHSYVSDLKFTLTSPQGTTITLFEDVCGDDDDLLISLDDEASGSITCPINLDKTEKPADPLAAFIGENPQGQWKLTMLDSEAGDTGVLQGWTLEICSHAVVDCLPFVGRSGPNPSALYQSSGALTADGWVNSGDVVTFKAVDSVKLNSVFNVFLGSEFEVIVDDCSN